MNLRREVSDAHGNDVFSTSMEGEIVPWVVLEQLPYTKLGDAHRRGATI
jgi:hypothetical protein